MAWVCWRRKTKELEEVDFGAVVAVANAKSLGGSSSSSALNEGAVVAAEGGRGGCRCRCRQCGTEQLNAALWLFCVWVDA